MTNVLMAIDESERSQRAARTAATCFGPEANFMAIYVDDERPVGGAVWGTPLRWGGVYAYPELIGYPYGRLAAGPDKRDAPTVPNVDDARQRAARLADEAALDAEPIGEVGDPAEAIARAARDHDADVIVVGWHKRNWFTKLFEGSTSDDLIESADVPVMVVPDTAD